MLYMWNTCVYTMYSSTVYSIQYGHIGNLPQSFKVVAQVLGLFVSAWLQFKKGPTLGI